MACANCNHDHGQSPRASAAHFCRQRDPHEKGDFRVGPNRRSQHTVHGPFGDQHIMQHEVIYARVEETIEGVLRGFDDGFALDVKEVLTRTGTPVIASNSLSRL